MTQTEKMPLTISIRDYAQREAEKKIDALGLTDIKQVRQRMTPEYERIRDQVGKQIMTGSLCAYTLKTGLPERLDVTASVKHPLLVELAAWLDGKRSTPSPNMRFDLAINTGWIAGLHIKDVDIAAELAAALAENAELKTRLEELETGGVLIEGKYPRELDAAITLYRAVASKPLPIGSKKPKKALLDKAQELFPRELASVHERLATVCNWEKAPGASKKES